MHSYADLWDEQVDAIKFMYPRNNSLLLADVGCGKTIMTLSVLKMWIDEGKAIRTLVVAPKRVCQQVWEQEIRLWSHIVNINPVCVAGKNEAERYKAICSSANLLLLNYEMLPWFMSEFPDAAKCNVLVCDEVDKLKNHKSQRFAGGTSAKYGYISGMRYFRKKFDRVIGMTGTPQPNHLLDLWSQVYVVDGGRSLGPNYYAFRRKYFYPDNTWSGYATWKPFLGAPETVMRRIRDMCFRVEASSNPNGIPKLVETPQRFLSMPKVMLKTYRRLEREYVAMFDGGEVSAINAGVLYGKLRQFAQGYVIDDCGDVIKTSDHKIKELDSLVSELQGNQLIIVYHYRAQADALRKRYGDRIGVLGGDTKETLADTTIERWNRGDLELLAVQPMSAGHGLNLQKSNAHHIVFLTLPESAGLYEQVIGRICRTGNKSPNVYVHTILTENTIEIERLSVVQYKIGDQHALLASMKRRIGCCP